METPLLYRQLQDQLRQWVQPKDRRHLQGFAEIVAAILQSESACLGEWIPYLGHRHCQARAHMERLSYFVHNDQINAERFYEPILRHVLAALTGESVLLTLDTSMLWDQFCLIEVCCVWGGRSFTLAQVVIERVCATVGFEQYQGVLECAKRVLPPGSQVTLLADRGFEHGALIHWLQQQAWSWAIRVKSDLKVTLASGRSTWVEQLFPPAEQAYLFANVRVLDQISCHLATATVPDAKESWAVLSDQPPRDEFWNKVDSPLQHALLRVPTDHLNEGCPLYSEKLLPSVQTFDLYGKRNGCIEPHFKDYKSAAFDVLNSGLRHAQALTCLFMLLDCASLIALMLGMMLVQAGQRSRLDWHSERGLSFLQLGLRQLARLCYERLPLPNLRPLPKNNPPPACASRRKREILDCRIEFSKVVRFS